MTRFDIVVAVALFATVPASAQTAPSVPATPSPQSAPSPNAAAAGPQLVDAAGADGVSRAGRSMTVTLSGLDEWRKAHKDGELILFLDVTRWPTDRASRRHRATGVFHLDGPRGAERVGGRHEPASVCAARSACSGGRKGSAAVSGRENAAAHDAQRKWFLLFVVAFALLLTGFLMVARTSDLLREGVVAPPGARRPYSLGRTQWRSGSSSSSRIHLHLDRDRDVSAIDAVRAWPHRHQRRHGSRRDDDRLEQAGCGDNEGKSLDGERLRLETRSPRSTQRSRTSSHESQRLCPAPTSARCRSAIEERCRSALKKERTLQIQQQFLAIGSAAIPRASRRFLDDILSDENGVSFHRFRSRYGRSCW